MTVVSVLCALCTIVTPARAHTHTHTQEEVTRLGCAFPVASLVARENSRAPAGLTSRVRSWDLDFEEAAEEL